MASNETDGVELWSQITQIYTKMLETIAEDYLKTLCNWLISLQLSTNGAPSSLMQIEFTHFISL